MIIQFQPQRGKVSFSGAAKELLTKPAKTAGRVVTDTVEIGKKTAPKQQEGLLSKWNPVAMFRNYKAKKQAALDANRKLHTEVTAGLSEPEKEEAAGITQTLKQQVEGMPAEKRDTRIQSIKDYVEAWREQYQKTPENRGTAKILAGYLGAVL